MEYKIRPTPQNIIAVVICSIVEILAVLLIVTLFFPIIFW